MVFDNYKAGNIAQTSKRFEYLALPAIKINIPDLRVAIDYNLLPNNICFSSDKVDPPKKIKKAGFMIIVTNW